jgi:hypothetical protein
MNNTLPKKSAVGVKIIPLRETVFLETKIVRLGPPPDNAGILIRGGMAWVLGILTKPLPTDPRIVRLQEPETMDQVMVAMWREFAYQWVHYRGVFAPSSKMESAKPANPRLDYAKAEQLFVARASSLWPGYTPDRSLKAFAVNELGPLRNLSEKTSLAHANSCSCVDAKTCFACHAE